MTFLNSCLNERSALLWLELLESNENVSVFWYLKYPIMHLKLFCKEVRGKKLFASKPTLHEISYARGILVIACEVSAGDDNK